MTNPMKTEYTHIELDPNAPMPHLALLRSVLEAAAARNTTGWSIASFSLPGFEPGDPDMGFVVAAAFSEGVLLAGPLVMPAPIVGDLIDTLLEWQKTPQVMPQPGAVQ